MSDLAPASLSWRDHLLSPTQIDTWTLCQRKWAFRYVERVETPQHPSAALGTEVQDTQLDPYLRDGKPFDFTRKSGEIANALVPLIPAPKAPGMVLRQWFEIPSPSGGFGYHGELDLWATDSRIVPGLVTPGRMLLGDFKSTGDFKWQKTSDDLKTDTQCQTYAFYLMIEKGVEELDVVWWYTRTRGARRAQRTYLYLAAPHVIEEFEKIDAIGKEIVGTRIASPKANEIPPSPRACEAFGGCPYRSRCNLAPPTFAAAWNERTVEMGDPRASAFLAGLMKPGATPPAPAVPSAPPAPSVAVPAAFARPVVSGAPLAERRTDALPAINPPESALPPAPPVGAAAPVAGQMNGQPAMQVDDHTVSQASPRPRGRPKKAANEGVAVAPSTNVFNGGVNIESLIDVLEIPRAELAALFLAWAAKLQGGAP